MGRLPMGRPPAIAWLLALASCTALPVASERAAGFDAARFSCWRLAWVRAARSELVEQQLLATLTRELGARGVRLDDGAEVAIVATFADAGPPRCPCDPPACGPLHVVWSGNRAPECAAMVAVAVAFAALDGPAHDAGCLPQAALDRLQVELVDLRSGSWLWRGSVVAPFDSVRGDRRQRGLVDRAVTQIVAAMPARP